MHPMQGTQETILVAMSGGVDSSVAAARLKEAGHPVIGVFMRNGIQAGEGREHRQGCCSVEDALDARRVADQLDIPFYALNLEDAFDVLIDDFAAAYGEGRTPNPCIECNRRFKLGALLNLAGKLGAEAVATGHYARVSEQGGRLAVEQAATLEKDQSYVLFSLEQDVLQKVRFPLGELEKAEVRAEARRFGLRTAEKPESMEICFVPSGDYRDVLKDRIPDDLKPGVILDRAGETLGQHGGTPLFTIGQRRGLPGGQDRALYVTALDPTAGTVTVGHREDLLGSTCIATDVVWSGAARSEPGTVWDGRVKIRHHHAGAQARVTALPGEQVQIVFEEPQSAITPGQAAVLYAGGRIMLGGWIASAHMDV